MRRVQWGWKVTCATKGCHRTVEQWGGYRHGPPPLPAAGSATSGLLAGWFLLYRNPDKYEPFSGVDGVGYIAYCPEHAAEAVAWQAARHAWDRERREVAKVTSMGFLERLAEWISPAAERQREIGRQTWEAMTAWKATHPAPKPPWLS